MSGLDREAKGPVEPSTVERLAAQAAALFGTDRDLYIDPPTRASQVPRRGQVRPAASDERALAPLQRVRAGARPWADERPRTRADCIDRPRPCPWGGCRYHLLVNVTAAGGVTINPAALRQGDLRSLESRAAPAVYEQAWLDAAVDALDRLSESCALDVAAHGAHELEQVGNLLGCTRERVRQIQDEALAELRQAPIGR